MNYKIISLGIVFFIILGVNNSIAQELCESINEISAAVELVMETSNCENSEWKAPRGLQVRAAQLRKCCLLDKVLMESKIAFIVEKMKDIIDCSIAGSEDGLKQLAPACAIPALNALDDVLNIIQPVTLE